MPAGSRIPAPEGARRAAPKRALILCSIPEAAVKEAFSGFSRVSTKAREKPEHALAAGRLL